MVGSLLNPVDLAVAGVVTTQEMTGGVGSRIDSSRQVAQSRAGISVKQTMNAGSINESTQNVTVNTADRDYYFAFEVLEGRFAIKRVQNGQTYRVKVARSLNAPTQPQFHARAMKIGTAVGVALYCDPPNAADIRGSTGEIDGKASDKWTHEWDVTIAAPASEQTITLRIGLLENLPTPIDASMLTLPIDHPAGTGTQSAAAVPLHLAVAAPLEATVAARFAIYVNRLNGETVELVCPAVNKKASIKEPVAMVAAIASAGEYLEWMQKAMAVGAEANPDVIRIALEDFIARQPGDAALLVLDQAGSPLPWEMMRLSSNRYLGACASVVRWTLPDSAGPATILFPARAVTGKTKEFDDATAIDLDDVQYEISSEGVGLVYLGGDLLLHVSSDARCLDGLWRAAGTKTQEWPLDNYQPPCTQVVFASTPHSGVVRNTTGRLAGLPVKLLPLTGGGFVGVLAPVSVSDAREMYRKLRTAATQKAGTNPAVWLRDVRRTAAQTLQSLGTIDKAQRTLRKREALAAFAYVYYGPPELTLEVTE